MLCDVSHWTPLIHLLLLVSTVGTEVRLPHLFQYTKVELETAHYIFQILTTIVPARVFLGLVRFIKDYRFQFCSQSAHNQGTVGSCWFY